MQIFRQEKIWFFGSQKLKISNCSTEQPTTFRKIAIWLTILMVFSNQSLSSCAVNRSANTRVHSCFHNRSKLPSFTITSAEPFSIPWNTLTIDKICTALTNLHVLHDNSDIPISSISHCSVWSVITAHNLISLRGNDRNGALICVQHPFSERIHHRSRSRNK